jgi:hypothetical protein
MRSEEKHATDVLPDALVIIPIVGRLPKLPAVSTIG